MIDSNCSANARAKNTAEGLIRRNDDEIISHLAENFHRTIRSWWLAWIKFKYSHRQLGTLSGAHEKFLDIDYQGAMCFHGNSMLTSIAIEKIE